MHDYCNNSNKNLHLQRSYTLLGVEIHPLTIIDLNNLINHLIQHPQKKKIISSQNLHSAYIFHKDAKMRAFHAQTYKRIDGMPLVLLGKILGYPLVKEHRVTWVDFLEPFIKNVVKSQYRLFYLGSKPNDALNAITILRNRFPNLIIEYSDGYFNKENDSIENKVILKKIHSFKPDVLLVGMGMPCQEHWIYDNQDGIEAKVILTCGAAMEYVVGTVSTPPRWMGKVGLEWVYRFGEHPDRFWKRYCIEPWFLVPLAIKDILKAIFKYRGTR